MYGGRYHEIYNKEKLLEIKQLRGIPFLKFKFYYVSEYIKEMISVRKYFFARILECALHRSYNK